MFYNIADPPTASEVRLLRRRAMAGHDWNGENSLKVVMFITKDYPIDQGKISVLSHPTGKFVRLDFGQKVDHVRGHQFVPWGNNVFEHVCTDITPSVNLCRVMARSSEVRLPIVLGDISLDTILPPILQITMMNVFL